jgi:hypothetical protein
MSLLAARLASKPAAQARPRRPGFVRYSTGAAGISQDKPRYLAEDFRYQPAAIAIVIRCSPRPRGIASAGQYRKSRA